MDPHGNLFILYVANGQKHLSCGVEDGQLSFGFRVDSRVVAHLFLVHKRVQGRNKLLPITHHSLILNVRTIDKFNDCIQDIRDELVGSEIGEDIVT